MDLSSKYRPKSFSEVIGQDVVTTILKNSIKMDRIPSAILLTGIRGIGKTTLARLFSRAVNCENFTNDICNYCKFCSEPNVPNIWEFDSASNNSVEDIRNLEGIINQKILQKYKVIILDEVHQLSKSAQSAFLKILEEPPKDVIFILSTTDPEKLEKTIISRCLYLTLRSFSDRSLEKSLREILKSENIEYSEDFLQLLVRNNNGSLRDAQKLLERILIYANGEKLDANSLAGAFGVLSKDIYRNLFLMLNYKNVKYGLDLITYWYDTGEDLELIFKDGIPNICNDMTKLLAVGDGNFRMNSGLNKKKCLENLKLDISDIRLIIKEWEVSRALGGLTEKMLLELFLVKVFNGC